MELASGTVIMAKPPISKAIPSARNQPHFSRTTSVIGGLWDAVCGCGALMP
jgi:hypothetical protein